MLCLASLARHPDVNNQATHKLCKSGPAIRGKFLGETPNPGFSAGSIHSADYSPDEVRLSLASKRVRAHGAMSLVCTVWLKWGTL